MSRAREYLRVLALGLILGAAMVAPMLWICYQVPATSEACGPLPPTYGTDC